MYQVTVRCEKAIQFASGCKGQNGGGWTTYDLTEPVPDGFPAELERAGWVERDGKHYCPKHDPAKQGQLVQIGMDYVELAPGVRVRWPGADRAGDSFPIEVQRDEPSEAG
jgi:hypothetical protein